MAEWFSCKIGRLKEHNVLEAKKEYLKEMLLELRNMETAELKDIMCNLDFAQLFSSQLTSDDRDCITEICNIANTLEDSLEPGEFHKQYPAELNRLITHKESAEKLLALKVLEKQAGNPESLTQLLQDIDLVTMVVEKIGDTNLTVANRAMDVMKKLGSNSEGRKILYSGRPMRTIARHLVKNDEAAFRVYEVIVEIAKSSRDGFDASVNSGFLHSLINVLNSEDVLVQLNALELLSDLATTDHGLEYLDQTGLLRNLADKIARADEEPLVNLVVPHWMKFFGVVAKRKPNEFFSKYPVVISAFFEVLEGEDTTLLETALDTLGHVASSVEGKYALQLLNDAMPRALKRIGEIIRLMPTELRVRGLENLALILKIEKAEQDNRILSLTKSWFDYLADDSLGTIVALCKQPFPDIRQSSLEVLATISSQTWGQEYIANCSGLVEFLLDRKVEAFANCKLAKHRIVANLCDADRDVFDAEILDRLKKFTREGPYHVEVEREIGTEGAF